MRYVLQYTYYVLIVALWLAELALYVMKLCSRVGMSATNHMVYLYIVGIFLKSLLMGPTVYNIYVYLATHMVGGDFVGV